MSRNPTPARMVDIPVYGRNDSVASFHGSAFLIDKPEGWTSFQVVEKLREMTNLRKIGHTGTLDPMATGLLICCVGRPATKQTSGFVEMAKEYRGTLRLGQTTPSYDRETAVDEERDWRPVTQEDLEKVARAYTGTITQRPPLYSAVRVEGERLYRKARRGEEAERPEREVDIYAFSIGEKSGPHVTFTVRCSRGTYIRSLAHDVGQDLGVGAHLAELRRTAIGPYTVDQAWTVEKLEEVAASYYKKGHPSQ